MILTLYKLYLKHHLRYLGMIVMGLFNALLRAIILVFFAQAFTSSSIAKGYGLTAMMLLSFVSQAMRDAGYFFRQQEYYGTFYRIFATPASRISIIFAFSLASSTLLLIEVFSVILVGRLIGVHIVPGLSFRLAIGAVRLSVFGFAMLISPIGIAVKNIAGPVVNLVQTIIYLLTGVFFPVSLLPHALQEIAYALPFTRAFEAFRGATIYGRSLEHVLAESLYAYLTGLIMLALSSIAIRLSERRAMEYGYERL